jgi:hypothetical protein
MILISQIDIICISFGGKIEARVFINCEVDEELFDKRQKH